MKKLNGVKLSDEEAETIKKATGIITNMYKETDDITLFNILECLKPFDRVLCNGNIWMYEKED